MDIENTEKIINELLIFMNDEVEAKGYGVHLVRFNFAEGKEHAATFCESKSYSLEDVHRTLRICTSRGYVEQKVMGAPEFGYLNLTKAGQGRGLSSKLGGERTNAPAPGTQIGTLNVHGPTQVGNGNTQNFEDFFNHIIKQIDNATASDEDKAELKNLLQRFLEHPLTTSIAGGVAGGLAGSLIGGGK